MKAFAALFTALDATTSTSAKVQALRQYLATAPPRDAAWAVYVLSGGRPRRAVPTARLRALACELAGIEDWLFDECYQAVGDLAETIAHVVPLPDGDSPLGLADWMEQRLLPLRGLAQSELEQRLRGYWAELDATGRFLFIKLVGGGFRVGISRLLVQRALAQVAGLDASLIAQRMMGYTDRERPPDAQRYAALLAPAGQDVGEGGGAAVPGGQPYPFFLANALEPEVAEADADTLAKHLGPIDGWLAEWKFDGVRAQLVRRCGQTWLWSRGEELLVEQFPDIVAAAAALPDGCVLDGEILVWHGEGAAPFSQLLRRTQRQRPTRTLLAELPAVFMAYDLLECDGCDLRSTPQSSRRERLEVALHAALAAPGPLRLSPRLHAACWSDLVRLRAQARAHGCEGLMLKRADARYGTGRTRSDGLWLKWKLAPMTLDVVLVQAQPGHGRRAALLTDYGFAVWSRPPHDAAEAQAVVDAIARGEPPLPDGLRLLTVAKAYSGLTDAQFRAVDAIARRETVQRFGPVRMLRPTQVFELAFEGIAPSARHKSGVALRFPRMLRWRQDKPLHQAACADDLQMLLKS